METVSKLRRLDPVIGQRVDDLLGAAYAAEATLALVRQFLADNAGDKVGNLDAAVLATTLGLAHAEIKKLTDGLDIVSLRCSDAA